MLPVLRCAASTLVADALATAPRWAEVARTTVSVHYETGDRSVPVVCVATAEAVRLPHSLVVAALPARAFRPQVTRWWVPSRPAAAGPGRTWPHTAPGAGARHVDLDPASLLGRGEGLTPAGDDVLAGALVAAHATGHPDLARWRAETVRALATRRTTAVSVGMLHSALDGWAVPELAAAVDALCGPDPAAVDAAVDRLLAVGHSSGRHLLDGVLHVLSTHPGRQPEQGAA